LVQENQNPQAEACAIKTPSYLITGINSWDSMGTSSKASAHPAQEFDPREWLLELRIRQIRLTPRNRPDQLRHH
jgi:hypothetical protein